MQDYGKAVSEGYTANDPSVKCSLSKDKTSRNYAPLYLNINIYLRWDN
jgi:hypothetical protein